MSSMWRIKIRSVSSLPYVSTHGSGLIAMNATSSRDVSNVPYHGLGLTEGP